MPSGAFTRHVASGVRDHYVLIEQKTATASDSGYPVETWTALGYVWMNRRDVNADERYAASQEGAYLVTDWQMPYQSDMDPELVDVPATRRLHFQGRLYNIRAAVLLDRFRGIELKTLAASGVQAPA